VPLFRVVDSRIEANTKYSLSPSSPSSQHHFFLSSSPRDVSFSRRRAEEEARRQAQSVGREEKRPQPQL
jgi:hypothetical protein